MIIRYVSRLVLSVLLICGGWPVLRVCAGEPGPIKVKAHSVRYLDGIYFRLEVPGEALGNSPLLRGPHHGIPCEVKGGPAFQVYLVPPLARQEISNRRTSAWGSLNEAEQKEYRSLSGEQSKSYQELMKVQKTAEGLREIIKDKEISDEVRHTIKKKKKKADARLKEIQERQRERNKRLSELNKKRYGRPESKSGIRHYLVGRSSKAGAADILVPSLVAKRPNTIIATVIGEGEDTSNARGWLRGWVEARLGELRNSGHDPEYTEFMQTLLRRRYGIEVPAPARRVRPNGVHLYDLFAGSTAIRESMQMDRTFESLLKDKNEVPIKKVQALALKDHPFEKMRKGRPFAGSSLAALCPRDALYLRVRSLKDWFRLKDLTDRWGGNLLSTIHVSGKDRDVFGRYARQLGLGNELIARLVGTRVVGEFAVVATDPLFAEGTGLALVFAPQKGSEKGFSELFVMQRRAKSLTAKDARATNRVIEGVQVEQLETPDGRLRSLTCTLGSNRVFANSPALLTRIIQASKDPTRSLLKTADYQYYRALFPLDSSESAFVYLSQDWFRRITGPAWRIAHGRRRAASRIMREVGYAWQSAQTDGTAKPDLTALAKQKWIDEKHTELIVPVLDPDTGDVSCGAYGPLHSLYAVDERLPTNVSREEQRLYDRFRKQYSRYWRQFIDPVGIRLRATEEKLEVDTLILPLIENSIYGRLRSICGVRITGQDENAPVPSDALGCVTFRWKGKGAAGDGTEGETGNSRGGRQAPDDLLRQVDEALGHIATGRYSSGVGLDPAWFGNAVTFGVADGDMLFSTTSDMSTTMRLFGRGNSAESLILAAVLSSITLPTYGAVEVRDAAAVERFLDGVWKQGEKRRRGWVDFRVLAYRTASEPRIHTVTFTIAFVDFRVHYTFANGWLLAATKPDLLKRMIVASRSKQKEPFRQHGRLLVRPPAFNRVASTVGITWQERVARACRGNLASLQRAASAGRYEQAERFLGYRAICPEGGRYSTAGENIRCSVHGTRTDPTQPLTPPRHAPAVRLVNDIERISVGFAFTGDGLHSQLRMVFKKKEKR